MDVVKSEIRGEDRHMGSVGPLGLYVITKDGSLFWIAEVEDGISVRVLDGKLSVWPVAANKVLLSEEKS